MDKAARDDSNSPVWGDTPLRLLKAWCRVATPRPLAPIHQKSILTEVQEHTPGSMGVLRISEDRKERAILKIVRDIVIGVLGGVVIDATLEYFRVEILFPVLPYIWLSIACFLTVDGVRRSRTVESYALKLYGSLDARRRMISYIVVAIVGAGVFDLYWLGISRVFQARGPMKASFSEKAKESNTVLSARTQNPSASKQQGTQDADGSGQYTTPSAATTSHVANPIGNLARLGWGVKDTATFEINAKPLPDLQESALYSRALRKPFQLHFQQVSSIAGLHLLAGTNCVRIEISASDIEDLLIEDLSPIEGLRSLKDVDVRDSAVVDLSPLSDASQLEQLTIDAKQAPSLDRVT
jgi:hypothetical protein